jgi:hypothetical protein
MRETVIIRFQDHQKKDGVQEYVVNIALPGIFQTQVIGASQEELSEGINKALGQLYAHFHVPHSVDRIAMAPSLPLFTDSHGRPQPMSPFAGTAKATFKAEIYRKDGTVVE